MNFLPFVITFLLILVIGSTTLFSSVRSTSLEKKILMAQTQAKLTLISEQARASFKAQKKEAAEKTSSPNSTPKTKKQKTQAYIEKRFSRAQYDSSKLNLWPLIDSSNPALAKLISESGKRLIEYLYREADFYHPGLADAIMREFGTQKGETFHDFFPKDNHLGVIYYKMLKGTNTSYPALTEYFKIEKPKKNTPPVHFLYASAHVMQAVLGEDVAKQIFAKERALWEQNPRNWAMTKEQVRELLIQHPSNVFDINNLDTAFVFQRTPKGLPHAHIEETSKVMAVK